MPAYAPTPARSRPLRRRQRGVLALVPLIAVIALLLGVTDAVHPTPARATVLAVPAGSDALLVQPRPGISLAALAHGLELQGYHVQPGSEASGAVRLAVPPGEDPAALAAAVAAGGLARGVEPDIAVYAAIVPNDLRYAVQSGYLEVVHAPAAWELTTGAGGTVIAIVDSGLDYNHPEFRDRIAINLAERFGNERDDDRNGCADDVGGCNFVTPLSADPSCGYVQNAPNWRAWDDAGHGTIVAGIAAAAGDNTIGLAGIAWDARILPVKVLDCTGVGRVSTVAAGIRYAVRRGAHVINISLGTYRDSSVLREAIEHAQRADSLIVASAGNVPGAVSYPGAYPGVIAVGASGVVVDGALDYTGPASFTGSGPEVDLLAPGVSIIGPLPPELCGELGWQCDNGPYIRVSGSSFAAAIVTGAAALLRERSPTLGAPLLRIQLLRSLQPTDNGGNGLLDIAAALETSFERRAIPGTARPTSGIPTAPRE